MFHGKHKDQPKATEPEKTETRTRAVEWALDVPIGRVLGRPQPNGKLLSEATSKAFLDFMTPDDVTRARNSTREIIAWHEEVQKLEECPDGLTPVEFDAAKAWSKMMLSDARGMLAFFDVFLKTGEAMSVGNRQEVFDKVKAVFFMPGMMIALKEDGTRNVITDGDAQKAILAERERRTKSSDGHALAEHLSATLLKGITTEDQLRRDALATVPILKSTALMFVTDSMDNTIAVNEAYERMVKIVGVANERANLPEATSKDKAVAHYAALLRDDLVMAKRIQSLYHEILSIHAKKELARAKISELGFTLKTESILGK